MPNYDGILLGPGPISKVIANLYDPEETYYEGDVCIYDGKLYKCLADIDTPEAWNSAHWIRTKVMDEAGSSAYTKVDINQGIENAGKYMKVGNDGNLTPDVVATNDFTGATSTTAGAHGLVPAPAVADREKFLCGDGTWSIPVGGKLVEFDLDTVTNTSGSYTHATTLSDVTHDMKVVVIEVSNPSAFLDEISVTTADGSITLACDSVSGTSEVHVSCVFVANASAITSSEFDVLSNRIGSISQLQTTVKTNVVAAINEVHGQISDKVDKLDIADNLTTNVSTKVLSAAQGYTLKGLVGDSSSASGVTGSDAFAKINTLNSNLANKVDKNSAASLVAVELSPNSSTAGHGGYIDFHYNGSSADYTSRIIETSSGDIAINGISIAGLNSKIAQVTDIGTPTDISDLKTKLLAQSNSISTGEQKFVQVIISSTLASSLGCADGTFQGMLRNIYKGLYFSFAGTDNNARWNVFSYSDGTLSVDSSSKTSHLYVVSNTVNSLADLVTLVKTYSNGDNIRANVDSSVVNALSNSTTTYDGVVDIIKVSSNNCYYHVFNNQVMAYGNLQLSTGNVNIINDLNSRLSDWKIYTKADDFGGSITSSSTLINIINAMQSPSVLLMSPGNGGFGSVSTLGAKCNGTIVIYKWSLSRHIGFNMYGTASNATSHEGWYFRAYQTGDSGYDAIIWSDMNLANKLIQRTATGDVGQNTVQISLNSGERLVGGYGGYYPLCFSYNPNENKYYAYTPQTVTSGDTVTVYYYVDKE